MGRLGRRQRSLAKRHPMLLVLWGVILSIVLRVGLRSDGLVGRIANGAAVGFAAVGIIAIAYIVVRFRINDRLTDDRIDELLARRVKPNVRSREDR